MRQKYQCIICHGSSICIHEKVRYSCVLCNPKIACQHCKYINIRRSRWKPNCFRCHCVLHPDDPIPRRFRLKEHYVVDALRAHFQDTVTMRCDKSVDGGCTRYRPDILIDFGSHIVIVEIDEFRHTNYVCEQKRMVDLYEDMGYRNTIFIRFNPDGYNLEGIRYPTPFPVLDNGDMSVNEEEMADRMYELIQTILFYKDNAPDEPITYNYLFYGDQPLEGDDEEVEEEAEEEAEEAEEAENTTTGI